MQRIYQVTIHGRVLESSDLRKLLSRAVSEKKAMDKRLMLSNLRRAAPPQEALTGAQATA